MIRVSYQDDAKVGKEIDKPRPLFASSIDNYLELLVLPAPPPPPQLLLSRLQLPFSSYCLYNKRRSLELLENARATHNHNNIRPARLE
jgi:hypothetical protein